MQYSNHGRSNLEAPTSASLFPERPRGDVDSGSRKHSPEVRDVHGL